MSLFIEGVKLCADGISTWRSFNHFHAALQSDRESNRYVYIALTGAMLTTRTVTLVIDLQQLKRRLIDQETEEKLKEFITTAIVVRGLSVCLYAGKNILDGTTTINLANSSDIGFILQDFSDATGTQLTSVSRAISIVTMLKQKPEIIPRSVRNKSLDALFQALAVGSPPIDPDSIPFDPDDTTNVDLKDLDYSDIPFYKFHSSIFRAFVCPISHRPIRYPVVILDVSLKKPLKLPLEFFERKALFETVMKKNTGSYIYPNTAIDFTFPQVREYLPVKRKIEQELNG